MRVDALLYAVWPQALSTLLPLEAPPLLIIITNSTVLIVIITIMQRKPLILLDIVVSFRVSMWNCCPFMRLKKHKKFPKIRRIATLFFSSSCNHWINPLAKQSHLRHNRPYKHIISRAKAQRGLISWKTNAQRLHHGALICSFRPLCGVLVAFLAGIMAA